MDKGKGCLSPLLCLILMLLTLLTIVSTQADDSGSTELTSAGLEHEHWQHQRLSHRHQVQVRQLRRIGGGGVDSPPLSASLPVATYPGGRGVLPLPPIVEPAPASPPIE